MCALRDLIVILVILALAMLTFRADVSFIYSLCCPELTIVTISQVEETWSFFRNAAHKKLEFAMKD